MTLHEPPQLSDLARERQHLGEAIRTIRKSRKLTQQEVATHLGWARTTIVAIERGLQATTVDQLVQLATVIGVAVTVFFPLDLHLFDPWHPDVEQRGKLSAAEARRRRRR